MAPPLLLGSVCSCGRGQVNQERPSRDGHIDKLESRRVELSQSATLTVGAGHVAETYQVR